MTWMDINDSEMVNLDRIVRAHPAEDGLSTVLYTHSDSFIVPVQYATFRAVAKFKKDTEMAPQNATNLTLQKILSGQSTQVP